MSDKTTLVGLRNRTLEAYRVLEEAAPALASKIAQYVTYEILAALAEHEIGRRSATNTHIVLIDRFEGQRLIRAPDGFDWLHYPEKIELEGIKWRYMDAGDGIPHYREGENG